MNNWIYTIKKTGTRHMDDFRPKVEIESSVPHHYSFQMPEIPQEYEVQMRVFSTFRADEENYARARELCIKSLSHMLFSDINDLVHAAMNACMSGDKEATMNALQEIVDYPNTIFTEKR